MKCEQMRCKSGYGEHGCLGPTSISGGMCYDCRYIKRTLEKPYGPRPIIWKHESEHEGCDCNLHLIMFLTVFSIIGWCLWLWGL